MVQIEIQYNGELRNTATHGPSHSTMITDAPVDNHGKGESFSPTDLVATALGTCMATIMGIAAQRKNIDLRGMTVTVQKTMSADLPRRIVKLESEIKVPLAETHPDRKLLEAAALGCPVHHSLAPEVERPVKFVWVG